MDENIYKTPQSNFNDLSSLNIGSNLFQTPQFKKTIIMNVFGGIGLSIICIVIFLNKVNMQLDNSLIIMTALFAFMAFTAFGSAYAIKSIERSKFRFIMLVVNWLYIAVFIMGFVGIAIMTWSKPEIMEVMLISQMKSMVFFVLPQAINITAFRAQKNKVMPNNPN